MLLGSVLLLSAAARTAGLGAGGGPNFSAQRTRILRRTTRLSAGRSETAHLLGHGDPAHAPTTLQRISARRDELARASAAVPGARDALLAVIDKIDNDLGPPLDLAARLTGGGISMAAEFKRASPSKGNLALGDASAADVAREYAAAGAALISILTEPEWFKGSLDDLLAARKRVNGAPQRPALLRKDFVTQEHMVLEARAHGADTVLLIVACLRVSQLRDLVAQCRALRMEPLVEVHTEEEMRIALEAGSRVIGINNRNLHTFKLDMGTTARLAQLARDWERDRGAPAATILALSGVADPQDVDVLVQGGYGVECVLVGETLMRSPNPKESIAELLGGSRTSARPLAKVCGITTATDAVEAARGGADLIGVIFAPKSKRLVDAKAAVFEYASLSSSSSPSEEDDYDSSFFLGLGSTGIHAEIVGSIRAFGEREARWAPDAPKAGTPTENLAAWAAALRRDTSRGRPLVVGVVQDQALEEVVALVEASGVDLVQLHGDETADYAGRLPVPHLRVLHADVDAKEDAAAVAAGLAARCEALGAAAGCCGILVDAAKAGARGGVGEHFDWAVAKVLTEAHGIEPLVAGGLGPRDVAAAKAAVGSVLGFDASSRLEQEPRHKDQAVVRAYVAAVHAS